MQNTTAQRYAEASLDVLADAIDIARFEGDLETALILDDLWENKGGHADDRATCYSCQTWANHSHPDLFGNGKVYFWPMVDRDLPGSPLVITEGVTV